MTFDEAVLEANEQGWYLYQLWQEPECEVSSGPKWGCTLRALEGGYRREISNGTGETWIEAISNALAAAPEMEREIAISLTEETAVVLDLTALMRAKFGPPPTIPRRRL